MSRPLIIKLFLAFAVFSVAIVVWVMLSIASIDRAQRAEFVSAIENHQRNFKDAEPNDAEPNIESTSAERDSTVPVSDTITELPFNVSIVYSQKYLIDLGGAERLHPFDIKKYARIFSRLVKDDLLLKKDVWAPAEIGIEDLLLVHSEQYLNDLNERKNVAAYLEAPILLAVPVSLDKGVLSPFRFATGGTLLAARKALSTGIGVNIGGGYHHAKPDKGEGFCLYADVPIAIRKLQSEKAIERALVIDVDVHQGNGTIVCLDNDDSTYTFSMHQREIYPIPKETGDRDVALMAGMGDVEYMALLHKHLPEILDESDPDICFIVAGCDTLDGDPLADLKMTETGIVERDAAIVAACVDKKIPVVFTASGGYSKNAWHAQYLSIRNLIETYSLAK